MEAQISDIEEDSCDDNDLPTLTPIDPPAEPEQNITRPHRRCTEVEMLEPIADVPSQCT